MKMPALFMSCDPKDDRVIIESVWCGRVLLIGGESSVENYRFGRQLEETLAAPLAVLVRNGGDHEVRVGASLASREKRPGAYSGKNGE